MSDGSRANVPHGGVDVTVVHEPELDDPMYWCLADEVKRQHPGYNVEIHNGEYVVVAPHDLVSARLAVRIASRLEQWVGPRKLGGVFDSNAGFVFPDGDVIAPDVTYVSHDRLPVVPRSFARVVPELAFEIRSSTQSERACRAKTALLLAHGIDVVVFVDPGKRTYEIHRAGSQPVVLSGADRFEVPDVLPGFGFGIDELWGQ